jgi:hypothetical protein
MEKLATLEELWQEVRTKSVLHTLPGEFLLTRQSVEG